jgi:hypothetical protein
MIIVLPETSAANILLRRAHRLRKITGKTNLQSQSKIGQAHMTPGEVAFEALSRHVRLQPGGIKSSIPLRGRSVIYMYSIILLLLLLYRRASSFEERFRSTRQEVDTWAGNDVIYACWVVLFR